MASLRLRTRIAGCGILDFRWRPSSGTQPPEAGQSTLLEFTADDSGGKKPSWRLDGLFSSGPSRPFLHLDIRTPFGEPVAEEAVHSAFTEALGPAAADYRLHAWHVLHQEDIHVGTNHRVFAELVDLKSAEPSDAVGEADGVYGLALALETLGEILSSREGQPHFQLVVRHGEEAWSLLHLNAQPFHILRAQGSDASIRMRLTEHHRYLLAQKRQPPETAALYLAGEDPLRSDPGLDSDWNLRDWTTLLPSPSQPRGKAPGAQKALPVGTWVWHQGLLQAARREDFAEHNRVPAAKRKKRAVQRDLRATAIRCLGIALLGGVAYAAAYGWGSHDRREIEAIREAASHHAAAVRELGRLRQERSAGADTLQALIPLARPPVDLARLTEAVASALPEGSALDAYMLKPSEQGHTLHFRASVPDWETLTPFQDGLTASGLFAAVEFLDQRKDPERDRIFFQAACRLKP